MDAQARKIYDGSSKTDAKAKNYVTGAAYDDQTDVVRTAL